MFDPSSFPKIMSNGIADIKSIMNLPLIYLIAINLGSNISSSVIEFYIVVLKFKRISIMYTASA